MSTKPLLPELKQRLQDIKGNLASAGEITEANIDISGMMQEEINERYLLVYEELNGLSTYIDDAKVKISELCSDEIRVEHLPAATDQLDAIVADVEVATNTILGAAEIIAAKANELDEPEITEQVIKIFEASSFQDLTGQRTSKVISTLKFIEKRIHYLVLAFYGEEAVAKRQTRSQSDKNPEDGRLEGPQLPGEGNKQAEIDAVLASFD